MRTCSRASDYLHQIIALHWEAQANELQMEKSERFVIRDSRLLRGLHAWELPQLFRSSQNLLLQFENKAWEMFLKRKTPPFPTDPLKHVCKLIHQLINHISSIWLAIRGMRSGLLSPRCFYRDLSKSELNYAVLPSLGFVLSFNYRWTSQSKEATIKVYREMFIFRGEKRFSWVQASRRLEKVSDDSSG